jgi:hypothetical protein
LQSFCWFHATTFRVMAPRPFMNNFRILRLPYELTSNSGLAIIGQYFKLMRLDQHVDPAFPVRDT